MISNIYRALLAPKFVRSLIRTTVPSMYQNRMGRQSYGTASKESEILSSAKKCLVFDRKEGFMVTSPFQSENISQTTVDRYVWRNIAKWPNHIAIECGYTGRKYTYSMLRDSCSALAIRLRTNLALEQNDVVAICLPNVPEYPIALLGGLESGLTVTTINPSGTAEEMSQQLANCKPKLIFCSLEKCETVKHALSVAQLDKIKIVALRSTPNESYPSNIINFDELIDTNGLNLFESSTFNDNANVNDVILLPYSSGTTGLQKGVMHTHSTTIANTELLSAKMFDASLVSPATADFQEVIPCFLPFYHIYGLAVLLLNALLLGCKIVTMPTYQPDKFLDIIKTHKASFLPLVPPVVIQLNNFAMANATHFQSVRAAMSGASSLAEKDVEQFVAKNAPECKFVQGYGMTEGIFTITPKEIQSYGTVGWPLPNVDVKITRLDDAQCQGVAPNQIGELLARGSCIMKGYYKNAAATHSTIIDGGWIRTGDIAYYDENGLFYICDRLKELIKVNAHQVAPAELEGILREHRDVLDAAVVGIPYKQCGEVPKAFIVRRPGSSLNELQITDFMANRVSKYKHLTGGVQFIEKIPKSASGKILRREIKRLYC